ncbi:hypothetical protein BCF55_0964 [Hydrogenivirga caldilitoris]|uniref:Uncharacterized protein n=1 Tax=Hydrogenivirga caldilitoris TaxID=246264 RepID=A0A497XUY1_9AQUI|nr:hypothetical protein [Hydrogenivirga caldilitoris]RLJ70683.1 hypothetical protein BCF55_0964 [Hydrogenivirga caldilitoris]
MKELILSFLQGREDLKTRNFFIKEIRQLAVRSGLEEILRRRIGDDYAEEILSVLRFKLLKMSGSIAKKGFISTAYLRKVIYSCIIDTLNGEFSAQMLSMEELNYENQEGDVVSFEENIEVEEDKDLKINAQDLFGAIMNILKEEDIKVMCYYFCKELYSEEIELEGLTKTNLYKRWERLKKRLAQKLPYVPTKEEFREFAERFLSEVCESKGYITERGKDHE